MVKLLDFRNFKDYLNDVSEYNPDYLFHIGAHTDLEYLGLIEKIPTKPIPHPVGMPY